MFGALALLLASACPSVSAAGSLPTVGPVLRGDVDGDGRRDRVTITHAPRAPTTCGFFALARTANGNVAARLPLYEGKIRRAGDYATAYREPTVMALAAVDGKLGLEIVVRLWHGASHVGGALLTVRDAHLLPMRLAGRDAEWVWGGGVASNNHIDCVYGRASGYVAISSEWVERDGRTFGSSRALYRAEETTFRLVRRRERRRLRLGQTWRSDVPEVRGFEAWHSCWVVSAR